MAGRYDKNPFDEEEEEVNPFSNPRSTVPIANSRLSPLPPEPVDFYDRGATVDIPLDTEGPKSQDLKKKEKELQAKDAELRRREQEVKRKEDAAARGKIAVFKLQSFLPFPDQENDLLLK